MRMQLTTCFGRPKPTWPPKENKFHLPKWVSNSENDLLTGNIYSPFGKQANDKGNTELFHQSTYKLILIDQKKHWIQLGIRTRVSHILGEHLVTGPPVPLPSGPVR